jgi:hypothetical protein
MFLKKEERKKKWDFLILPIKAIVGKELKTLKLDQFIVQTPENFF